MTAGNQCLYGLLGVTLDSSAEDIKKAYYALAKKLHPDKNQSEEAEEKFKAITAAYDILKDDQKRSDYDIDRKLEEWDRKKSERQKEREEATRCAGRTSGTTFSFSKNGHNYTFRSTFARFGGASDSDDDFKHKTPDKKEKVNKHRARARRAAQRKSGGPPRTAESQRSNTYYDQDWDVPGDSREENRRSFASRFRGNAFKDHDDMVKDFFSEAIFDETFPSAARNKFFSSFSKDADDAAAGTRRRSRARTGVDDDMWDWTKPLFGNKRSSKTQDEGDDIQLTCRKCGHKFPAASVLDHERLCMEYWGSTQPGPRKAPEPSKPSHDWRKDHEELLENIRKAKQEAHKKQSSFMATKNTQEEDSEDDSSSVRVACRYCGRRFSASSAQRHVPFCHERTTGNDTSFKTPPHTTGHDTSYKAPPPPTPAEEGSKTTRPREYSKTVPPPRPAAPSSFPTMEDLGSDEEEDYEPRRYTPRRTSNTSTIYPDVNLGTSTPRGPSVNGSTTHTTYERSPSVYSQGKRWSSQLSGGQRQSKSFPSSASTWRPIEGSMSHVPRFKTSNHLNNSWDTNRPWRFKSSLYNPSCNYETSTPHFVSNVNRRPHTGLVI